jgi:hypothetical protein
MDEDFGLLIKPRENAARQRIDLDGDTFRIGSERLLHRAEKMAYAYGRLQYSDLCSP